MDALDATAYLAPDGFEEQLLAELSEVKEVFGRLVLAAGPRQPARWAQNVWLRPHRIPVRSIADAAAKLRAIQRNWVPYTFRLHRRAALIAERLPHVSAKPLEFPTPPPRAPLGSFTLLEPDLVLASPECSSPFPHGEAAFVEFHEGPPSRAYLKLWEALTLLGRRPESGERCLDAGASPGSWSWALARLKAEVVAIDRAPLDPTVAALPGVEYRKGSAFSIQPRGGERFDWIFSDVVCYPERLWRWVKEWLDSGRAGNFVCTLKFQGREHYQAIDLFAAVPGSRVVHLSANRHELTWLYPAGEEAGIG